MNRSAVWGAWCRFGVHSGNVGAAGRMEQAVESIRRLAQARVEARLTQTCPAIG